jgi:PAS domain S-box-containing protein
MQGENIKKDSSEDKISRKIDYLFKYTQDWIFYINPKRVILDSNDRVCDFIGVEKDKVIGKDITYLEASIDYIDGLSDNQVIWKNNVLIRQFKVKYRPNTYRQSITYPVENNGKIEGYIIAVSDISETILLELAEKEHYQTTRALLNSTIQSAMLLDDEGYIIEINDVLLKNIGKTYGEMIGTNVRAIVPDELKQLSSSIQKKTFQAKIPTLHEYEYNSQWYRIVSYPVLDDNGKVYRLSVFAEDITDRKKIEQQLLEYQNHLENLVKERTSELEDMNTTLQVLLKQREKDKEALEQKIVYNLKELVFPALDKIKNSTQKDKRIMNLLDVIQQNLEEIVSPFSQKLSSRYFKFTPTELNIANLIKHGKTTKDISETLFMAYNTVEFHRANIRKKLGISNQKVNLRTHLQFIGE